MSECSISSADGREPLVVRPGKWTFTLISLLRDGSRRFSELKREAEGISQKTLTLTLRELERDGFVGRTMFATIPPRVDYSLTDMGRELLEMSEAWRRFALKNRVRIERARDRFDGGDKEPGLRLVHSAG